MDDQIVLNLSVLNFVAASLIPLATALITKARADSRVKSLCTLALTVIAGTVGYLIEKEGKTDVTDLMSVIIATYLTASVTYSNLWKPTGVAPKLTELTPNTGIGTAVADPEAPKRVDLGRTVIGGETVSPPAPIPPQGD